MEKGGAVTLNNYGIEKHTRDGRMTYSVRKPNGELIDGFVGINGAFFYILGAERKTVNVNLAVKYWVDWQDRNETFRSKLLDSRDEMLSWLKYLKLERCRVIDIRSALT